MSKEKNTQQMSLWEGSHVNPSASQENKKVQTMTAISGQKCLDSLGRSNPNSLLGRMCKDLLTSKTAWYSDRCKTTWKVKVSKSNVSLFQLQASVLGTKGTESGLWLTPSTTDYSQRSPDAMKKRIEMREKMGRKTVPPGGLSEQVQYGKPITDMRDVEKHLRSKKQSFPTPTTFDSNEINKPRKPHPGGGQKPPLNQVVKMYPTPTATERSGINPKTGKGAGLSKMVKMMYPTPTAQDHSRNTVPPSIGKSRGMDLSMRVVADEIERQKKMYPTPTQDSASERTKKYKQGGKPLTVAVQEEVRMYPTPTVGCEEGGEQSSRVERTKSGGFILRKKNKPESTFGAKLSDAMLYLEKMYPTPTARDYKDVGYQPTWKPSRDQSMPRTVLKNNKPGGKLNPTFVEFLMGFPMNWTKTEPTESKPSVTQSSHRSQESSDSQSKKFYRTPTAMDKGDNSFKYAAKILKGKLNRSQSKQPVQKTLSMDVAMEHLKDNQHLINEYDEKFKTRPHLPPKDIFLKYLKENLDKKKLIENNIIKKTTIDHWLRSDHCFAYPTVEYWNMIKPYLKEIKFDKEMTTEIESDWE